MNKVVVIGGGYVGQLVQLACPLARVLDWKKQAPTNHLETRIGPQYLWEPIPGVPYAKFEVTTLVDGAPPTPDGILAYKQKIGKVDDGGDWGRQFEHKMPGYHSELPVPLIEYDRRVIRADLERQELFMADGSCIEYDVLINTIPLPAFLDNTRIIVDEVELKSNAIYMLQSAARNQIDGMQLNYLSSPEVPWYRVTQSWDGLFFESLGNAMGCRRLLPGKIHPHKDSERLLARLRADNIYCFGRYATWRPDELAHETWREIERMPWMG